MNSIETVHRTYNVMDNADLLVLCDKRMLSL